MSLVIIVAIKGPRKRKGKKGRTSVIAAVAVVSIAVSFNIVTSCKLKPIFKVIIWASTGEGEVVYKPALHHKLDRLSFQCQIHLKIKARPYLQLIP